MLDLASLFVFNGLDLGSDLAVCNYEFDRLLDNIIGLALICERLTKLLEGISAFRKSDNSRLVRGFPPHTDSLAIFVLDRLYSTV